MKHYEYVYNEHGKFEKLDLDSSVLSLKPGQMLIKPLGVGICGSDLYLIKSNKKNLRLGHEWYGEVIATQDVQDYKVGDLVTGSGHVSCGHCNYCLQKKTNLCENLINFSSDKIGALRTAFVTEKKDVYKIEAKSNIALTLLEIFAVGEQAYSLLTDAKVEINDPKLIGVFGAGPIGLATALVLKSYGLDILIIEKLPERVLKAKSLGFKAVTVGEAAINTKYAASFDVVVDCTNDYSGDTGALKWLPFFTKKEFTGLIVAKYINNPILFPAFNSKAAQLIWMRGVSEKSMLTAIDRWQHKVIDYQDLMVTHIYQQSQIDLAFAMADNKTESIKVVISLDD
ncbi:MAG: zinc-binding dehydrogenase [Pseudobdellovibrio sp.]